MLDNDTKDVLHLQESNGTVLSTNWKDIGKKMTECTPPTGMEAKKYATSKLLCIACVVCCKQLILLSMLSALLMHCFHVHY